jgi:hypothetical protein
VAQDEGPEFKSWYCKKTKAKENKQGMVVRRRRKEASGALVGR